MQHFSCYNHIPTNTRSPEGNLQNPPLRETEENLNGPMGHLGGVLGHVKLTSRLATPVIHFTPESRYHLLSQFAAWSELEKLVGGEPRGSYVCAMVVELWIMALLGSLAFLPGLFKMVDWRIRTHDPYEETAKGMPSVTPGSCRLLLNRSTHGFRFGSKGRYLHPGGVQGSFKRLIPGTRTSIHGPLLLRMESQPWDRQDAAHLRIRSRWVVATCSIWLWGKSMYPNWNPGKWKHGLKPAVPWWFNLTHTHTGVNCQGKPKGNHPL